MQTYQIEMIVAANRVLTIRGVPFRPGEEVQAIILDQPHKGEKGPTYPLRGNPLRYMTPFDSVAENDWSALQ